MDAAVLFLSVLITYAFLRMHGGKGISIKAKIAPASTPEGKRDRIIGSLVLAQLLAAVVFVGSHQKGESLITLVVIFLFGAFTALSANSKRIKRK